MKISVEVEYHETLNEIQKLSVWRLLCICDSEFVPPLSARSGTIAVARHNKKDKKPVPTEFFDEMLNTESFFLATNSISGEIVAFLSLVPNYNSEVVLMNTTSHYISTICVLPIFRRKGIANGLYKKLFAHYKNTTTYTVRTWTQNKTHRNLLSQLGFSIIKTFLDERGKGIDTLYYKYTALEN